MLTIRFFKKFLFKVYTFSLFLIFLFKFTFIFPIPLDSKESKISVNQKSRAKVSKISNSKDTLNFYKNLTKKMNQLVHKSKLPKKSLSLIITHPEGFQYTLNSTQPLNPASLTKIVIAAACLSIFPLNYRFKTELFMDPKKKEKNPDGFYTLNGNLYLKGGGDPGFTSESLWKLVNRFKREKILKINGDIVVDSTLFDHKKYDGRRKIRVESSYDAPIEALSFNWNTVNIFVRPSHQMNQPALVFIDPFNHYIKVINRSETRRGSKNKIQVRRTKNLHIPGDTISIKGFIGIQAEEKVFYRNVTQPALWTGYNLKSFLEQRKIKVLGTVKKGVLKDHLKLVSTEESLPLRKSISDMMKFSNNFVADMLTKNLSLQGRSEENKVRLQGNTEGGLLKIKNFLKNISILEKDYILVSPSGLSNKNRFRAQDIHRVLKIMKGNFRIFPDFLSSFPSNAVDGTLKDRVDDEPHLTSLIRAKTGTLNHVAGLSGYIGVKNGPPFIFTFLFNAPSKYPSWNLKARKLREKGEVLFDQMAKLLLDFSKKSSSFSSSTSSSALAF